MNNNMSAQGGSAFGGKKSISIGILVLVVVGLGYYLFKISPAQTPAASSSYNSTINQDGIPDLSAAPAFDPTKDHYIGNPAAKNVFIEYADYECPACAAYSPILKPLPTTFTDTVFVFRYFPLIQIHPNSVEAALAAEAAGAQGKYWEMHDILFAKQGDWEGLADPIDAFAGYAQSVGVANIDQFKSDITSKKYLSVINQGYREATGLKLPGTPSFFFNGHTLQNQDLAGLKAQADPFLNK